MKCQTKQIGKDLGIILPQKVVKELNLKPDKEIELEIKKDNVLKKLFGTIKFSKPIKELLKEARKDLESKYQ
mgnify:CR=1 FL=1